MNLPPRFISKMQGLLGEEFEPFIRSFEDDRVYGLRANTLKIEPKTLAERLDILLEKVPWCEEGFYYKDIEGKRPSKHPYYQAGLYYIQEPSAMSSGSLMPIYENDRVLDLCAAPGGKSTQAAAKLNGTGILISNDISASRCKALIKNIETAGVTNCIVTNEYPERLVTRFRGFFNKIIVDAPCSGEGMFRKNKDVLKSWEEYKFCGLQKEILKSASEMLCGGGIIAYSTCTFAPEENEGIIDDFLKKNPDFEILEIDKTGGFDDGKPEWVPGCNPCLKKAGRLMPYHVKGEGHFLCLLKKKGDESYNAPPGTTPSGEKQLQHFRSFVNESLNKKLEGHIALHGISVFMVPFSIDTKGLRIMRSGFYLGDIKTKRFEPSWALAMALKKEDARHVIDFELSDPDVERYLRGESFQVTAEDGWNLVCVDSFPLGFGKVKDGRMKNKRYN